MIRVDPSPILFYFYFFIRSELVRVDPSWSGPTFVPASYIYAFTYIYHQQKFHILLLLTE